LRNIMPDLLAADTRWWAALMAAGLVGFGLWFIGRDDAPEPTFE